MQVLRPALRSNVSLRVAGVTKVFGDTIALWDVDLDARSGDLVAVHGANGSGKTTLLGIIAGLIAPTRGTVVWTTDAPGTRPRVGLLGHASHLFDELTAIENVALAARLARTDEAFAIDLLGRVGVAPWGARRVGGLSAGTRRRVGLARVLATDPDVLLIDEPFAVLDRSAADLVGQALTEVRNEGTAVVIATHDDTRSRCIATTSMWLDAGRFRPTASRADGAMTR